MTTNSPNGCGPGCGCGTTRREALKYLGLGAVVALGARVPVMAGPFDAADFDKLVPVDKKLSPEWIKSLFERGAPTVYRAGDLKYIGMPVGGITTGQVYLGGDGKLWHWDIFNQHMGTGDHNYSHPVVPTAPLEQGFALSIGGQSRKLEASGFSEIAFCGQYPIGTITYSDPACPVGITLEAFSPFIPLHADDSGLPATIMQFTLHNNSTAAVEATLTGTLENAVCLHHRNVAGQRLNRVVAGDGYTLLECAVAKAKDAAPATADQPDIVFEDWNKETYEGWTVEGEAFGKGPIKKSDIPDYQGDVGGDTPRVVNSHASAPGTEVGGRDNATGKLTSRSFKIERNFIRFWIGGGNFKGKTCLNLVVAGKVVQTTAGKANNAMEVQEFDVRHLKGKDAVIEIVDAQKGAWGNIGVGKITFSDKGAAPQGLEDLPDFGTMGLALLGPAADSSSGEVSAPLADKLIGELGRKIKLDAGQKATVTFVVTWCFPNLRINRVKGSSGRYYATRWPTAAAAADYVVKNFDRLAGTTRLWRDTWYDSSLPFWLLDRTLLNASILATSTAFRFSDGRFYGWEGVGCCDGTCTHVWQYEQAVGRLFPELDILLRERAEFNPAISFRPNGMIEHRGEFGCGQAVDGQAGTIFRAYRDHLTSPDDAFLKRNWAAIKKATQWLIEQDGNADGILEGAQHNTLDAEWYGPVAWLSGMYLGSLRAAEEMARLMGDDAFAQQCHGIVEVGVPNFTKRLFNGEYFMNIPDPKRPDSINSGTGCEIDQVLGQSWAWQVGLGRVLPEKETKSALAALWKYNFAPDAGGYHQKMKAGRWYAMPGEAGLLMCTFPRSDWSFAQSCGKGRPVGFAMYFNECMNGFEHQAAGHMVWEGLVQEGLAVERAIHDRYGAAHRNPWNEVECGDHYARSMASYGVFIAACGFEYDGPRGYIGFAPRLTPEDFKAAFTAAEGWGTFAQKRQGGTLSATIVLKHGRLRAKTLALTLPDGVVGQKVQVTLKDAPVAATIAQQGGRVTITLAADTVVETGQTLALTVG